MKLHRTRTEIAFQALISGLHNWQHSKTHHSGGTNWMKIISMCNWWPIEMCDNLIVNLVSSALKSAPKKLDFSATSDPILNSFGSLEC